MVKRRPREARVEERAHRSLHHLDVVVRRIEGRQREVVGVDHERVPNTHRHDLAVGAQANAAVTFVALLRGLLHPPAAVVRRARITGGVVGVVVVVEEVPAGDVVGVAVAVAVVAVTEHGDQVAGVEDRIGLAVSGGLRHARVVGVVVDVERAVAVTVVHGAIARIGVLGKRKLSAVQRNLAAQAPVVPANPRVEDRDLHARAAGRVLPCSVDRDAWNLAERVASGERVLRDETLDVRVDRVVVERGVLGAVGREAEALVLLVEGVRAGRCAILVVVLAVIEVRIVRRVHANALAGVAARKRARVGQRRCDSDEHQREREQPRSAARTPLHP